MTEELSGSCLLIQGFNQGGQRSMGFIKLEIHMEDLRSSSWMHVIDAKTSYNILLGRPWVHENRIVSSSYYQCLKYLEGGIERKIVADDNPFTKVETHFADAKFYLKGYVVKGAKSNDVKSIKSDKITIKRIDVAVGKELNAKIHIVVYTKEHEEDEESVGFSYHVTIQNEHDALSQTKIDKELEDIDWCCHISVNDNDPLEEEAAVDAPPKLEEGGKTTIDPLKEVNIRTDEDPRPTFLSTFLEVDKEIAYVNILKEYRDVLAWSYKEMRGLNPNVGVHQLAVKMVLVLLSKHKDVLGQTWFH
ncbi:hypothetical protein KY290_000812 [Solanum tuberosum]|uniref:Uncharacterized protein n=1 Tax=Solanum tuberosum TaxID=4113 RepID=A0ABQ7WMF1_SOLTU|nr:hypothetical protein KY290_000812 [Solanum tuberosum]